MTIRSNPTYLSTDVHQWLRLIGSNFDMTADEVADSLLRQVLETKCPAFQSLKKEMKKLEGSISTDIKEAFELRSEKT